MKRRKQDDFEEDDFEDENEDENGDFGDMDVNPIFLRGTDKDRFGEDESDDDDDINDDGPGGSPTESLDIPDLPGSLTSPDTDEMLLSESGFIVEKVWHYDRSLLDTVFDPADAERIPGISRSLLSIKREHGASFGMKLCRSLAADLRKYYDRLLFGLADDIYLHSARSEKFECDQNGLSVSIRFFWSEEESPYRLIIPNVTDITENEPLTYLLVGDLLEEFLDGLEKGANG